ncbi:Flp pilus assembly protein CpaB [Tuwongella immobilis]|uniref:Pilus assembly protein CpaB n=1 Tax=Tuwongella immobilis TaxID=692036 RepID=A0A6C2YV76_9BACT|nr:Flp pilus assembly protein CpaB [Tuwongella immobilis]VIP05406.1 Pilus assembly protein CpaB OS=Vibrio variabilis GN=NL53_11640 PE=4 SV=1 [Tuwongella immobilis]VTS08168.1 Pilus assembly protein CpaB OS=Vibrio variabilis GN=NL53_11640 PE=4 SV=1 [Tuwongella immobilis]
MKQKNVVLLIVSIGIALVAAYLAANLNSRPAPVQVETEKVLAVAGNTELPVGTLLTKDRIEQSIALRDIPKEEMTPEMLTDTKQIESQRLTRTLRPNDRLTNKDVTKAGSITLPKGKQQYTLRMDAVRAVGGFVLPGAKVDIILTETLPGSNKKQASVPFRDMQVIAVDILDRTPEGGQIAIPTLQSVSIAVDPKEGQMLALAQTRGEITMMLRDPESKDTEKLPPVRSLPDDDKGMTASAELPPQIKRVEIVVARSEIPAGTQVTSENLEELFRLKSVEEPAPKNALNSMSGLNGKYLSRTLDAEQFLSEAALSNDAPKPMVAEAPKEKEPVAEKPKPKTHEITIQNGQNRRTSIYEGSANGTFRLTEKTPSDTPPDTDPPAESAPAPRPAPSDEKPRISPRAL